MPVRMPKILQAPLPSSSVLTHLHSPTLPNRADSPTCMSPGRPSAPRGLLLCHPPRILLAKPRASSARLSALPDPIPAALPFSHSELCPPLLSICRRSSSRPARAWDLLTPLCEQRQRPTEGDQSEVIATSRGRFPTSRPLHLRSCCLERRPTRTPSGQYVHRDVCLSYSLS